MHIINFSFMGLFTGSDSLFHWTKSNTIDVISTILQAANVNKRHCYHGRGRYRYSNSNSTQMSALINHNEVGAV
jgi:hypothetical protein